MQHSPWIPPLPDDQEFFQRFRAIADAYHDGQLTPARLRYWYAERLHDVLEYVQTQSPFYRRQLAEVDFESVSPGNLSALPFTTKNDLRREGFGMLCGDVRDAMYYFQTTGTTGEPTPCPRSVLESACSNYHVAKGLREILTSTAGADVKPIVAVLIPNELHSACKTIAEVCKDLGILNLDAWPGSPALGMSRCIEALVSLQVNAIVASPALSLSVARSILQRGRDPKSFGLNAILTLGEVCSPAMARNLASVWGCEAFDFLYGSQEAFVMATANAGGGLIPALPNYIFELIDSRTDRLVDDGMEGELCVTNLMRGVKPLIRYRTGDRAVLQIDPGNPVAAASRLQIMGRKKDDITIGGARYSAMSLEQIIMYGVEHCLGYQIELSHVGGSDFAHIRLMTSCSSNDSAAEIMRRRVADHSREMLGVATAVDLVGALDPITTTGSWVSWKAARIIDSRPEVDGQAVHAQEIDAARRFMGQTTGRTR